MPTLRGKKSFPAWKFKFDCCLDDDEQCFILIKFMEQWSLLYVCRLSRDMKRPALRFALIRVAGTYKQPLEFFRGSCLFGNWGRVKARYIHVPGFHTNPPPTLHLWLYMKMSMRVLWAHMEFVFHRKYKLKTARVENCMLR